MKLFRYILSVFIIATLAACGGGGGGGGGGGAAAPAAPAAAPPTPRVTIKLSTTGAPSGLMAGIGITITLPSGVTPALNADGSVAASVVTVSGVAAPGTVVAPTYVAEAGAVLGTLNFAMASSVAAGFGAGEFATVVFNRSGGVTPVIADFPLSAFTPIAKLGVAVTGLTATVSSLVLL